MSVAPVEREQLFAHSVRDSFEGVCGRLVRLNDGPQIASVWIFVDHILQTYQDSVYVTVGLRHGAHFKPIYSNLAPEDRDFLGLRRLEQERFDDEAGAECIGDEQDDIRIKVRYLPGAHAERAKKPEGVGREISQRIVRSLYRDSRLGQLIFDALSDQAKALKGLERIPQGSEPGSSIQQDTTEVDALYGREITNRLGPLLDDLATSVLTQNQDGQHLNLFAVYRRPSPWRAVNPPSASHDRERAEVGYRFSVDLLLSQNQRKALNEKIGIGATPDISWPLESNERSIADTVLLSGNVDFSLPNETDPNNKWSRSYHPDTNRSLRTQQRRQVEQCLFGMAFAPAELPKSIAIQYVPIHVNGHPWVALFRVIDAGLTTTVEQRFANLHFYRDVAAGIAGTIARAIEEIYGDVVARTIAERIGKSSHENFLPLVNHDLATLSTAFPYGLVRVSDASLPPNGRTLEKLNVSGIDQPLALEFREPQINYRRLDKSLLKQKVENTLGQIVLRDAESFRSTFEVFGHFIGGLFQQSGIGEVVGATRETCKKLGPDSQRLADAVDFLRRRIEVAQGIGESLRLRKTRGDGFPRQWFSNASAAEGERPSAVGSVARACEQIALFHLWPRWSSQRNWHMISVDTQGSQRQLRLNDEYTKGLSSELCDLFPFSSDQIGNERRSGTIVVTLGLAELIFNATSSILGDLRKGRLIDVAAEIPLLHMQIEEANSNGSEANVKVKIYNCAAFTPNLEAPKAIQEIQRLEINYMHCDGRRVVETTTPRIAVDPPFDSCGQIWVEADWSYYFGRVRQNQSI